MTTEKVFFENSQGLNLCGILEEPNPTKEKVVIMVHGYASHKNRTTSRLLLEEFATRNINSFRIDLDGCGESEGNFAEQTISSAIDDILAAIKFVEGRGYTIIDLLGSSAGGLAVMGAALKSKPHKIGLKAPVSDVPRQQLSKRGEKEIREWKEKGFRIKINKDGSSFTSNYTFFEDAKKYVMYDNVKEITCPVLILHGDADESIPVEQSKKIAANFPNATLKIIPGADHFLNINGDKSHSIKLFAEWFDSK
jgi:uncharacterized protein